MAATDGEGKVVRHSEPQANVIRPGGKRVVKQQPLEEVREDQPGVSAKPVVIGDDASNRIVVVPDQGPPGVPGPPGPPGPEADWDNMPIASAVQKGGIKVGSGLTIDADGVLSAIGGGGNPGGQGDGNLGLIVFTVPPPAGIEAWALILA